MKPQSGDTEIGTFLALYIREDGGCYHVMESHWDEIDAALHQFIERGIDRVLTLTNTNGADMMLPVSRVGEVFRSTGESRETTKRREAAFKAEEGYTE